VGGAEPKSRTRAAKRKGANPESPPHDSGVRDRMPASSAVTGCRLTVRLLVYNIRYATGTGPAFHLPLPGAGYLRSNRRVLNGITEFIRGEQPDVVGLLEVDTGSIRTARELGHYSTFECKYRSGSINTFMPIVRKQANAFLSGPNVAGERFHYFDTGIKRLIIELELSDVCVFLVHLSVKFRHRQYQLRSLHDLVVQATKPVIVAGDFNTFWGTHELFLFMRAARLRSANTAGLPSFPARVPRIELDFILVSEGIEITGFRVPDVRFSDHRPLVCDFQVNTHRDAGKENTAASAA
jgi:endonuclease/exonuclease/phosphatase family metal-dependent hydrolase